MWSSTLLDSCGAPGYVESRSWNPVGTWIPVSPTPHKWGRVRGPRGERRVVVAGGAGLGERCPLRLEIHDGVAIGGLDARVAEPVADGDEVDAGLEQMDGAA